MKKKMMIGSALTGLACAGGLGGMVSAQSAALATGLTPEQIIEIALVDIPEMRQGALVDAPEMTVEVAAQTGDSLKADAGDKRCGKHDTALDA